MIFHENFLLADNSHDMSYLISSEIRKYDAKFVVCCSRDWRFNGSASFPMTRPRKRLATLLIFLTSYVLAVAPGVDWQVAGGVSFHVTMVICNY